MRIVLTGKTDWNCHVHIYFLYQFIFLGENPEKSGHAPGEEDAMDLVTAEDEAFMLKISQM